MTRHLLIAIVVLLAPRFARADETMSKEACVDAHSRGQDARDSGKLSLARKLFLSCAQSTCPALVQGDCARFADDMTKQQPTITFAARDASGADLPDTTVYIDGVLVVTQLDGKPHDIDPGNHTVKFQNGGKDQIVTIVINSGEKGRTIVGNFPADAVPATGGIKDPAKPAPAIDLTPRPTETVHPTGAKVTMIIGGLALAGGAALAIVGYTKIPDRCELDSHQCLAAPGDPIFDDAKKAVRLFDIGVVAGGIGAVALIGGLVWYTTGATRETEPLVHLSFTPFVTPTSAGFAFGGSL